jgi:NAD(P)-dependent dehydrogenase (short-subunit alcohol dehydrogenase family)
MKPVSLPEGKLALLTGAGRGIGRATAVASYADAGARVVIADISDAARAQRCAEVEATGASAWTVALDLTDAEACGRLAADRGKQAV